MFSITIYNPGAKCNGKLYTKKQINSIISRILDKEKPYSFFVYQVDEYGWKSLVYEYTTDREFYKK